MIARPPHPCPLPRRGEGVSSIDNPMPLRGQGLLRNGSLFPLPRREWIKGRVSDCKTPSPLPSPAKGRGYFFRRSPRVKSGFVACNDPFKRRFCFLSPDSGARQILKSPLASPFAKGNEGDAKKKEAPASGAPFFESLGLRLRASGLRAQFTAASRRTWRCGSWPSRPPWIPCTRASPRPS